MRGFLCWKIINVKIKVEDCLAVDLTDDEAQCLDSKYVVSVDLKGDIHGINKLGKERIQEE